MQSRINAVDEFTSDTELLKLATALAKITNKNQDDLQLILDAVSNQSLNGSLLAQDLNYISNKLNATSNYTRITGIDPSSGYTTALSLSGKFLVSFIRLSTLSSTGLIEIKLTVDGELKWDSSISSTSSSLSILGDTSSGNPSEEIRCKSSFILEVMKTDENDISLDYLARPIL